MSLQPPPSNPKSIHTHETLFPPSVARHLGLDPDTLATIEITRSSGLLFKAILLYAASHAVPLGNPLPPPGTSNGAGSTLRTLWNSPASSFQETPYDDSDDESWTEDSDTERDAADASEAVRDALKSCGFDEGDDSLDAFGKGCGLRKKAKAPKPEWQAGLGYAKLNVRGIAVYLYHQSLGEPVACAYRLQLFRVVTLAAEDVNILKEFCDIALKWNSARDQALQKKRTGKYILYQFKLDPEGCGEWHRKGYKVARPASTVILPKGQMQSIIKDVQDFMSSSTKKWYQEHGLPHRRSLLFHGIPGSGKTSSIRVLAGLFGLNACFLSLTGHNFNNQALQDAMSSVPGRALLVVEDCDALFNQERKAEGPSALTFSAFLNCLDGLSSTEGIITILTTNHVEKLDPALIRGGRVDRRFEFLRPDQAQLADLFLSFYKDASRALALNFARCVFERKESEARCIATLQQHFIYTRKRSAEECVEALPEFFEEFYPKGINQRQSLYM